MKLLTAVTVLILTLSACADPEAGIAGDQTSTAFAKRAAARRFSLSLRSGGHICVIDRESLKCWGGNQYGQTDVPLLRNPIQVTTGREHSCALDDDGVKCWGYDGQGQSTVPLLRRPSQVSAGD